MSIAVLVKQVPDTTSKISIANGRVDESSVSKWAISPYDEYALEAALQLKESGFGSLIAITCGPARSAKCLTDAAAVGADELIHVIVEGNLDSKQIQALLSAAISHSGAEVVLCGKQAADTNSGSTGPGLAKIMGAACVGVVSEVSSEGDALLATRSVSSGLEKVSVHPPCVITFDKGVSELRRPNVRGIMMAKKKEVQVLTPDGLGVPLEDSVVSIESHSPPPEKPPGQIFEGADSVPGVVGKLRDEANVI